ncbi:serine palmitoyltransferase component [Entomophthora muscae]|uniref:Serine palmitoyltransferase component n=1 Tax=Entomophthora muscae TaxID=34485 RepID=A0ACC2RGB9_9FUNG|nr:serine palmitoyltransferase component [Entomophthora muscae]
MFHRRVFLRTRDCFARLTTGVPGRTVHVLDRTSEDFNKTYNYSGKFTECLNLASYNYLGFSPPQGECLEKVIGAINKYGVCTNSPRNEVGYSSLHQEAERLVAQYVGKPHAIIQSQGFSTNSTTLPILMGKGTLIISDELNHSSAVYGARLSGANLRAFKHNSNIMTPYVA